MKIALVHKQFTLQGGTERYLVGLACFLAEREHEVHIFCSHVDPVLSGIRGLHLHKIRTFGLGGFLKALMFWLMVRLKVRPGEYDIVHGFGRTTDHDVVRAGGGCHRAYLNILQDRAAEGMARFRLAIDLRHRFNLWVEGRQLTGGHTARFIAVSEQGRQELSQNYPVREGLIEVLHNGVDIQRFHPKNRPLFFAEARREVHLVPEDTVILFVGGDWERKGLDSAMRVLVELQDIPDLKLLVAGADRRFDEYTGLARELGVLEQVHFNGAVERMERVYPAADVMLLPTRYDPFANVTLEALASEVPVVTTASNGASEVLRDSSAVHIVDDAEDVEGMAASIREFLEHPEPEALRKAAREVALENRDQDNYARVEAIYAEILDSRGGDGR